MEKSQLMRHSADTVDAVLENVRSTPLKMVHRVIRFMSADAGGTKYQMAEHSAKFLLPEKKHLMSLKKRFFFSGIMEIKGNVLQKQ